MGYLRRFRAIVRVRSEFVVAAAGLVAAGVIVGTQVRWSLSRASICRCRFGCEVSGGQVALQPTADTAYVIYSRSEQPFTVCQGADTRQCRTMMLQRFDIDCGGTRVAWTSVVAASAPFLPRRVSLDGNRLVLQEPRLRAMTSTDCFPGEAQPLSQRGRGSRKSTQQVCGTPSNDTAESITLPAGFAPLTLVRARLLGGDTGVVDLYRQGHVGSAEPLVSSAPAVTDGKGNAQSVPGSARRVTLTPGSLPAGGAKSMPSEVAKDAPDPDAEPRLLNVDAKAGNPRIETAAADRSVVGPGAERVGGWVTSTEVEAATRGEGLFSGRTGLSALSALACVLGFLLLAARSKRQVGTEAASATLLASAVAGVSHAPLPTSAHCETQAEALSGAGPTVPSGDGSAEVVAGARAATLVADPGSDVTTRALGPIAAVTTAVTEHHEPTGPAVEVMSTDTQPTGAGLVTAGSMDATAETCPIADAAIAAPTVDAVDDLASNSLGELQTNAFKLSELLHVIVEELLPDGPLRDLLRSELESADRRLTSLALADAMSGEAPTRTKPVLEQIIGDLQRIQALAGIEHQRVAQGVTQVAARNQVQEGSNAIPASRDEAIAFLGINGDAGDRVIKKVVDALRQAWHPDLARGEADRRLRETRMKQINGAWDQLRSTLPLAARLR